MSTNLHWHTTQNHVNDIESIDNALKAQMIVIQCIRQSFLCVVSVCDCKCVCVSLCVHVLAVSQPQTDSDTL